MFCWQNKPQFNSYALQLLKCSPKYLQNVICNRSLKCDLSLKLPFNFRFVSASTMTKSKSHRTQILHITYPSGVKEITQDLPKDELVRRMKVSALGDVVAGCLSTVLVFVLWLQIFNFETGECNHHRHHHSPQITVRTGFLSYLHKIWRLSLR